MTSEATDRGGIQVISRAVAVLRTLENEAEGLSLGEIAQRVALPRSTIQRIVGALTAEQFLVSASPKSRVKLGPALVRIGAAAAVDVTAAAAPLLAELSKKTGETVDLSISSGSKAVFVSQVSGTHRLRAVSAVGESFPLHCTANGKALLAALPAPAIAQLSRQPLEPSTANTIIDWKLLKIELEQIRVEAIAWDREEHAEGISAIGTAFLDGKGRAYAISLPVPTSRFRSIAAGLIAPLLATRDQLIEKTQGRIPC